MVFVSLVSVRPSVCGLMYGICLFTIIFAAITETERTSCLTFFDCCFIYLVFYIVVQRVLATVILSVSPSVCLSVTTQYRFKTS